MTSVLEKMEENYLLDFNDLFTDFVPDDICFLDGHEFSSDDGGAPNSLPSDNAAAAASASFSIGDIEDLLLSDDFEIIPPEEKDDAFLSGLLVNSPATLDLTSDSSSAYVSPSPLVESSNSKDCSPSNSVEKDHYLQPPQEKDHVRINDAVDDIDPDAKKRKRQLRNRDAAVRSRERKKIYVKDLEMKSRYYEAECRKLEWTLQCLRAENHALQFSLYTNRQASGTSTKQESAVLLLESLLLGSLLWLVGIIGLLLLPRQSQEAVLLESAEGKIQGSLAPRKIVNDVSGMPVLQSIMKSKRWRGSKTRMKVLPVRSCKWLTSSTLSSSYECSSKIHLLRRASTSLICHRVSEIF